MEKYHHQLFDYLEKLHQETKPKFGKMSAQHMVEHLSGLYGIAIGKIEVPVFLGETELSEGKSFLMSDKQYQKGFRAPMLPEEPLPLKFENIEIAKEKLKKLWEVLNEWDSHNFERYHPTFGKLNYKEWTRALGKHNLHHLTQFNLV